jgi:hypothetical protein
MPEHRSTAVSASSGQSRRHLTTVILEELGDGRWRATQTGVDVDGVSDSAAEAATEYCAKISDRNDGE